MKLKYATLLLPAMLMMSSVSHSQDAFPILEGPYLGQDPPGLSPEVFAPGIVTTADWGDAGTFSPDMNEFYVSRWRVVDDKLERQAVTFRRINNQWHKVADPDRSRVPSISPDGKTMYFGSKYKELTPSGWSAEKSLGPAFEEIRIMGLTASRRGTLVLDEIGTNGNGILRYSLMVDGKRQDPQPFSEAINTGTWNAHPFIAPDESYIMWDGERESGYGSNDLYISFKQENGSWSEAINLGAELNTEAEEGGPRITPDGKYLFFNRVVKPVTGDGEPSSDLFWVDAEVIEKFRPRQESQSTARTPYTIAYGPITGNVEIYSGDMVKAPTIERTNGKGGYLAWSPDGKQFAFYAKYDERKTWSIHTMNVDGTNRKRLTHAKNKWDSAPDWSPDGSKIVFAREYKDSGGDWQYEIWIMNRDGSDQTQIKPLVGSNPYFTSDGRIVFSSEYKDKNSEISIADVDGSNISHLTDNDAKEWHPDVSPDGTQIAFMSDRDGNFEIYVMNIDGSDQRRLTDNAVDDWYPSWSPDGSKIIFSSVRDYENKKDIYVMDKDGSSLKKIIPNSGYAVFKR